MIFSLLQETFAIARLPMSDAIPPWVAGELTSITRTADELSIVCRQDAVPPGTRADRGWRCLKLQGPIALSTIGMAADFTTLLAEARVGVLVISTFDTDYLLIKSDHLDRGIEALRASGHSVR